MLSYNCQYHFLVLTFAGLFGFNSCWAADNYEPNLSALSSKNLQMPLLNGPLKSERLELWNKFRSAEMLGIGVKPYSTALLGIESQIRQQDSEDKIRNQIELVDRALSAQILEFEKYHRTGEFNKVKNLADKKISLKEAREFILFLINKDRAKNNQGPLTVDLIATNAAQKCSNSMALDNCCGHIDPKGRKPWQRYTECGGTHCVGENVGYAHCQAQGGISTASLQSIETFFVNEQPPHDSHRWQILNPIHNKVGIGVAFNRTDGQRPTVYLAQEFIDDYGTYFGLPASLKAGTSFLVGGCLRKNSKFDSIEIDFEPGPKSIDTSHASASDVTFGDSVMATFNCHDLEVKTSMVGQRQNFSVTVSPTASWKAGLYYVVIMARVAGNKRPSVISVRTVELN